MNQERSPDDREFVLPSQLARVEQQLRQQTPLPVALDAATILRAAMDGPADAEIADHGHRERERRRGRWTALGASWLGGAIAGSIVTAFLLSRPADPERVSNKVHSSNEATRAEIATGKDNFRDGGSQRSQHVETRDEVPGWSESELLISTRILKLDRSWTNSLGGQPLQAGSYVRLTATAGAWPVLRSTVARPVERAEPTALGRGSSTAEAESAPSIGREELLQELLGSSSASTL